MSSAVCLSDNRLRWAGEASVICISATCNTLGTHATPNWPPA